MGGLVIKRAYILARQRDEFHGLAARVRTIVFLATPHRGADIAQLLSKILNFSHGSRPFVADLHRNSLATQSINDEFPQYCQDLQLYSFFETLPTPHGVGRSILVEKDLSILGYANERTAYLNANHREVCKYSSQSDPNYHTVRNALAHAIDTYRGLAAAGRQRVDQEHQRLLDKYLGVTDRPEDELLGVETIRLKGSCEWLMQRESFSNWRDSANTQVYWVSGKPAMGKTVLSGCIIHHLRLLKRDLCFYFFDYRNKAKTTIQSFLLSVAWQMAQMHIEMSNQVIEILGREEGLAKADFRTLWRKLYLEGLLKIRLNRPQYWVIDALEECKASSELVPMLLKIAEVSSIRILLTSRDRFEVHKQVTPSPTSNVIQEAIREVDVKGDIATFLDANTEHLPSVDDDARQKIVATILEKSAGCFLWVRLVLQELRRVHTAVEVRKVLEDIPSDMNDLYSRVLESMGNATYGKTLANAILTFTVCAVRPLVTHELYHALQIDLKDSIDDIERSIESSCGQLVYVDSKSRVQMTHKSAADFLLRSSNPDFAIDSKQGHKRIAKACFAYLNGPEMRGPRHRRLSTSDLVKHRSPFITYACRVFEHLPHVPATDDETLIALTRFLKSSNILTFIEYLCQKSDIRSLIHSAKALRTFVQRRAKYLSPLGKDHALMDSWATDLLRISTKFGKDLLAYPAAIFTLVPPFCPYGSAPRQQFASSTRGIAVVGLSADIWDDCLTTIVNARKRLSSIATSHEFFAIGMSDGSIAIHDNSACQEIQILQHGEPVKLLKFGKRSNLLVSSGARKIRVWKIDTWELCWDFNIPQACLAIMLAEEQQLLLAALKDNNLTIWHLGSGLLRESVDWTASLEKDTSHTHRRPIAGAFSLEFNLLAIVYRGQDILVWDLERDTLHDTYCKESGAHVNHVGRHSDTGATDVIFSAGSNAHLMVATYADGDLVLFDTIEGTVLAVKLANAHVLAGSSDGRTLATSDASGAIQIFDLETLKLLYRINSEEYAIRQMAFSMDDQRLVDVRGNQCRVWDPTVLVREDADDEGSETTSLFASGPEESTVVGSDDIILITSAVCCKDLDLFVCGKEDGSVWLYDVRSGLPREQLFAHARGVAILHLAFDKSNWIMSSIDSSSRIMLRSLHRNSRDWDVGQILFDQRIGAAVIQTLSNDLSTFLLVSTDDKDTLMPIRSDDSSDSARKEICWGSRGSFYWTTNPCNSEELILIQDNVAHLYSWRTLERLTNAAGILLEGSLMPELQIQFTVACRQGELLATSFKESPYQSKLLLWDSRSFAVGSEKIAPVPRYQSLASQVKKVIGEHGNRLVFLHASNWICSASLQSARAEDYNRHFFIPADWVSTNADLLFGLTANGDIIFVKRHEVAVIKRGLENVELMSSGLSSRPSLLVRERTSLTVPEP